MARTNHGKCPVCLTGEFRSGYEDIAELWLGSPVLIKHLPVSICGQCGHRLISARVAKRLEKLLDMAVNEKKASTFIQIPLVDFRPEQPQATSSFIAGLLSIFEGTALAK